jgi:CHAT domain
VDNEQIQHLKKLKQIHNNNLRLLEEQAAKFGDNYVPLSIRNEIETQKIKIEEINSQLLGLGEIKLQNNYIVTILFLAANPYGTPQLRLDEEVREIDEGLLRSRQREQFELLPKLAVRPQDIRRAILDKEPQIVHFSGHGIGEEGLVFEDGMGQPKFVTGEALAGLFKLFADQVECVLLNGCYSQVQAAAIAQYIPYVIGMKQAIGDKAAIAFAVGFYDALGAGRSIEFAYELGCNAIQMEGITENLIPVLFKREKGSG